MFTVIGYENGSFDSLLIVLEWSACFYKCKGLVKSVQLVLRVGIFIKNTALIFICKICTRGLPNLVFEIRPYYLGAVLE